MKTIIQDFKNVTKLSRLFNTFTILLNNYEISFDIIQNVLFFKHVDMFYITIFNLSRYY